MSKNGVRPHRSWRDIAEEATKETDPKKLMEIIEELCGALSKRAEVDATKL
jgi:hypothetical protein